MTHDQSTFEKQGAEFLLPYTGISEKLQRVKAFVFDWDGVFNDGVKQANGSSSFNEVDSMGVNLLRYSSYLKSGKLPYAGVISGEKNETAFFFAQRECFHGSYSKFKDKKGAIGHFCREHGLAPEEICFFFDDVLDLSVALVTGLRIFIPRKASHPLTHYVKQHRLADYITACHSGEYPVREACEMLMCAAGNFEEAIGSRLRYDDSYSEYISLRNQVAARFYTFSDGQVTQTHL
jgi:3-deoxy-D-manno-octulosonate 8-phosphate phosphatase (KDO 8-P phosphatase)